jgi:hypothetical protein
MTKTAVLVATLGVFHLTGCLAPASTTTTESNVTPTPTPTPVPTPSGPAACIDPGDCPSTPTASPSTPSTPSVANNCPTGELPVYTYITTTTSPQTNVGSGVSQGPGGASMNMTCQAATCATGQVGVVVPVSQFALRDGTDATASTGGVTCVEPPPSCAAGQYAAYIPPGSSESDFLLGKDPTGSPTTTTTPGAWHCVGACAVIVQYGPLFGEREVCAPPVPSCTSGTMANFDVATETWSCKSTCDPAYDVDMDGTTPVCVPC